MKRLATSTACRPVVLFAQPPRDDSRATLLDLPNRDSAKERKNYWSVAASVGTAGQG